MSKRKQQKAIKRQKRQANNKRKQRQNKRKSSTLLSPYSFVSSVEKHEEIIANIFKEVSLEYNLTIACLRKFIKIINDKMGDGDNDDGDDTEMRFALDLMAKEYNALLKTLDALKVEDPQVLALVKDITQTIRQCDVGECEFDKAELLINEASSLEIVRNASLASDFKAFNGHLMDIQLEFTIAIPYYDEAITIAMEEGDNKKVALYYTNTANSFRHANLYDDAYDCYERALVLEEDRIRIDELGEEDIIDNEDIAHLTSLLNDSASAYRIGSKYKKAESCYKRAIAINERIYGKEHLNIAVELDNLCDLYIMQAQYTQAKSYLEASMKIHKEVLGEEHESMEETYAFLVSKTSELD